MPKVQDTRIIHTKAADLWRQGEAAASADGKTPTPGCRQAYDAQQGGKK